MLVRDAMSGDVLVVGADQTIADAARAMIRRHVGAAVVNDDSVPGHGIMTERDVMRAVGEGIDPAATPVREVMTFDARTASVAWELDHAAAEMIRGGFRHLLVVDERGDIVGMVSMRDIVRARAQAPA